MIKILYYRLSPVGYLNDLPRSSDIYLRIIFDEDKTDEFRIMNLKDPNASYNWIRLQKKTVAQLKRNRPEMIRTIVSV